VVVDHHEVEDPQRGFASPGATPGSWSARRRPLDDVGRQSGESTLCRAVLPDLPLVSLEAPDTRAFAVEVVSTGWLEIISTIVRRAH